MDFTLPALPAHWDTSKDYVFHKKLAKLSSKPVEPAGNAFMARVRRFNTKRTLAEDYELTQALLDVGTGEEDEEEDEPESKKLLASNPANFRKQDHYAILGLSRKRWRATDEDIKKAYRKKVLKHHPDKKAHLGGNDNFFKCIQKAWEIITDPKKRIQFDSGDPTFNPAIPGPKDEGDFFELYGPVFARNAHFSTNSNPLYDLGDMNSPREHVEAFYQFWFEFESWRTFEFMDEEDTDKSGSSRDEKRWLDKKNVASRKKHKKEDIQRINRLIEQAFALDPRIKKFKAQDKLQKEEKKREKDALANAGAIKAAAEAEKLRIEQEEFAKAEKELAQKAKELKDNIKNAVKKEKKAIRRLMRESNSFLPETAKPDHILHHTEKIEIVIANNEVEYLEEIRIKFESAMNLGVEHMALVLEEEHFFITVLINFEKNEHHAEIPASEARKLVQAKQAKMSEWTVKEADALKKAVKLIPAGTVDRWYEIAKYVSDNAGSTRTAHACIHHAKKIQSTLFPVSAIPSKTTAASPANSAIPKAEKVSSGDVPTMQVPENSDWTTAQQLQLEAALKKYPAAGFKNVEKRWEKCAADIIGKDKRQVKSRMKELNDLQKKNAKK